MKYKLIALDLDGTLKNSNNEISLKTKEALMKAQEMGCHLVLASGRPTPGLRHDAATLELDKHEGYLLSYNGARVLNAETKETIYAQTLDYESAKAVIKKAKWFKLDINTYTDEEIICENKNAKYVALESNLVDLPMHEVEDISEALPNPLYKLLLSEEPEYAGSVVSEMVRTFPNLSVYRSSPFFIECMANGIDKAKSLEKLCEHLGITKDEVIAFGDGYNDLSMIDFAGLGVAMGNAVDGVKDKADIITKSNDEDGIAVVLEKVLF